MAEVLLDTSLNLSPEERTTNLEQALRDLKRACGQEGFLRTVREQQRRGYLTKSQRRHLKHKKAVSQWRRLNRRFETKPKLDQRKIFMQDHLDFAGDIQWATGDDSWSPALTFSVKAENSFNEAMISAARERRDRVRKGELSKNLSRGFQAVALFAEGPGKTGEITIAPASQTAAIPSKHVCVIGELRAGRSICIPLVRSLNDDGTARTYFQFPGGSADLQLETIEKTAFREMEEETGLVISPISADQKPIFHRCMDDGLHQFIAYRSRVQGGTPAKGEEIVQLEFLTPTVIRRLINKFRKQGERFLFPNHESAFIEYERILKAEKQAKKEARS